MLRFRRAAAFLSSTMGDREQGSCLAGNPWFSILRYAFQVLQINTIPIPVPRQLPAFRHRLTSSIFIGFTSSRLRYSIKRVDTKKVPGTWYTQRGRGAYGYMVYIRRDCYVLTGVCGYPCANRLMCRRMLEGALKACVYRSAMGYTYFRK